jgi:hypothetical protein
MPYRVNSPPPPELGEKPAKYIEKPSGFWYVFKDEREPIWVVYILLVVLFGIGLALNYHNNLQRNVAMKRVHTALHQ